MKKLPILFMSIVVITGLCAMFMKHADAHEKTISINGTTYISLSDTAHKYGYIMQQDGTVLTINGEGVNLIVNSTNNLFTVNGTTYVATDAPQYRNGIFWITSKDWANIFGYGLSNYKGHAELVKKISAPVTTNGVIEDSTYIIGEQWGERVPDSVKKHGNITNITTPAIEVPIYDIEHSNVKTEQAGK